MSRRRTAARARRRESFWFPQHGKSAKSRRKTARRSRLHRTVSGTRATPGVYYTAQARQDRALGP